MRKTKGKSKESRYHVAAAPHHCVCTRWLSTLLDETTAPPPQPPPPSLVLSLSPSKPKGAGGLKIELAAACSRELILHAAPVSLAHHQLDSDTDAGCCPVPATSGRVRYVLRGRDARFNQASFHLYWAPADGTYASHCCWKGEGTAGGGEA